MVNKQMTQRRTLVILEISESHLISSKDNYETSSYFAYYRFNDRLIKKSTFQTRFYEFQ